MILTSSVGFADCKDIFEVRRESARNTIKRIPGPIAGFEPVSRVVLAAINPWHTPYLFKIHKTILTNLPEGVKASLLVFRYSGKGSREYNQKTKAYLSALAGDVPGLREKIELVEIPALAEHADLNDANWVRDYAGQYARDASGKLVILSPLYAKPSGQHAAEFYLLSELNRPENKGTEIALLDFAWEFGNLATNGNGLVYISSEVIEVNKHFKVKTYGRTESEPFSERDLRIALKSKFGSKTKLRVLKATIGIELTGHLDMYIKFVDAKTALVSETPEKSFNGDADAMAEALRADGVNVIRIPAAIAPQNSKGKYWPGAARMYSYTNSLIVGSVVFMPIYSDAKSGRFFREDQAALKIYEDLGYKVIPVYAGEAILDQGSIHCLTSTVPASP